MSESLRSLRTTIVLPLVLLSAIAAFAAESSDGPVKFTMHRVGNYRSEACGVGDFNNDGKLDIIAGPYLYLAPDWKRVEIRRLAGEVDEQGKGYMHDFMNLPLDVDGDGRLDVVSCFWHEMAIAWYRNTGPDGGLWPESIIETNGNFETGVLVDLTGKGSPREILPDVQKVVWFEITKGKDGKPAFVKHVVSEKAHDYGVGVGDVNGDGRADIIRPNAWYEAPKDLRTGTWKAHPLGLGNKTEGQAEHTPQIHVYDVNGDGLNDIVTSFAHRHGIFWYEQIRTDGESRWKQHVIDDSWSQAHNVTLADIDGDGVLDLVAGKRFMAHNGNDPDETGPLGVYWYQLKRKPSVSWTKHAITFGEGIGAALNIPVVDLDGDGDLDIVVTGKWGGPVWFENLTRNPRR